MFDVDKLLIVARISPPPPPPVRVNTVAGGGWCRHSVWRVFSVPRKSVHANHMISHLSKGSDFVVGALWAYAQPSPSGGLNLSAVAVRHEWVSLVNSRTGGPVQPVPDP